MQNTSILLDKSVTLYTFLTKGGEQDESFVMGNENLKRVHVDGVGEEIRNRKIDAQQHRKR